MNTKVGIIGTGVVGTAIGVVLNDKGYEITGVYDIKSESTKKLVDRIGCTTYSSPQEVSRSADILFITTSDSAIQDVVDELAFSKAFGAGQVVIHTSGAQSSELLDKARDFGARVLSLHPLQSFANLEQAVKNIPGSIFSIEGEESTYTAAIELVEKLQGEFFFIDRKAKPLYHAGACVVSNYLVTVIDFGIKLLETTGAPREMALNAFLPLINGTLRNIENAGIPDALTGPISRGDISTVLNHLDCLKSTKPELINLYSRLGYDTAQIALAKGTIDMEQMKQFQDIFAREMTNHVLESGDCVFIQERNCKIER